VGVLGTVGCIVDVRMGASRSLGIACARCKVPCSPLMLITSCEDTTVRVLVVRAPVNFLALVLAPKAGTPLPFYWTQPEPRRKHPCPALQTHITTCPSSPCSLITHRLSVFHRRHFCTATRNGSWQPNEFFAMDRDSFGPIRSQAISYVGRSVSSMARTWASGGGRFEGAA